jgi:hypothetical protein
MGDGVGTATKEEGSDLAGNGDVRKSASVKTTRRPFRHPKRQCSHRCAVDSDDSPSYGGVDSGRHESNPIRCDSRLISIPPPGCFIRICRVFAFGTGSSRARRCPTECSTPRQAELHALERGLQPLSEPHLRSLRPATQPLSRSTLRRPTPSDVHASAEPSPCK